MHSGEKRFLLDKEEKVTVYVFAVRPNRHEESFEIAIRNF